MSYLRNNLFERVRSAFLAIATVCLVSFGIIYVLSLLLPAIGLSAADADTLSEARWMKGLFIVEPYLLTVSIVALMVVIIMDRSISIYNYRRGSVGVNFSGYDEWMGICKKLISYTAIVFFLIMAFCLVGILTMSESYITAVELSISILFLVAAAIMALSAVCYVVLLILKRQRIKGIIKRSNKAFEKYKFLNGVTSVQYSIIIDMLCESGLEPKTRKSTYAGANRDGVSNCLLALMRRGYMDKVTRENLNDVIEWLDGIDGLDAHFADSPDDFLEKFTLPSDLRLRRIAAIEARMEQEGV